MTTKRKPFDLWAVDLANLVGERGTCNRGRSGSVIVRDKQILSVGYVGAPKGLPHCDDKCGHEIEGNHCIRSVHSEINSIINAAKNGVALQGATLYTTMFPCRVCAMAIINAGIKRVVSDFDYQKSAKSMEMFDKVGITYSLIHMQVKRYEKAKEKRSGREDGIVFSSRRNPLQKYGDTSDGILLR